MYTYSLIIKAGRIEHMEALVNRLLVKHFGPDVHYNIHVKLTNEVTVILRSFTIDYAGKLNEWFVGAEPIREGMGFLPGTLLHWRYVTEDDPIRGLCA